ncbi:C39 family peptidase [Peptostreptococcus equinus]|uniref:C39 family peptidase n=1 Tax=Peptostreptococcus equinus TaxID=3003601 RepID=A0ABY7JUK2_9FIRM|nr:C39 family peptidase [Peptostreptococcus sp. CBA3647]WAW15412.1 C39 family peptidase [Peptostreptococcus sp. CBA3647]
MASINKNRKKTKYTFKGSNKNSDNKYANIYQDLSDKNSIYESNMLKQMHRNPDGVESELPGDKKAVTRVLSSDEAEKNAQMRKRAVRNESMLASEKSSPVISKKESPEFDKDKSIEKLKREKLESRLNEYNMTHDEKLDIDAIDSILDETDGRSLYEKLRALDKGDVFIHERARERANMDKSNVEIYKEYSDFERPTFNKVESDYDDKFEKISVPDDLGRTTTLNTKPNDRTASNNKSRESEIEELIRLMKRDSDSIDRKSRRRDTRTSRTPLVEEVNKVPKRDYVSRSEVYKKGNNKNVSRFDPKKIVAFAVILVLLLFFVAAAIDKFDTDKNKNSTTNSKVETKTTKNNKTAAKTETESEKIKKLEAIKPKLNKKESQELDYIIQNIKSYPTALIDLLIRNSETVDFVYSYKDKDQYLNKTISKNIDSSYAVDGDVPLFLQWDRRWGYRQYGGEMIGLSGCGPTSLAMVIRHFDDNSNVNPYDVAKYSSEKGYVSEDNTTSWKLFETGVENYGLESTDIVPVETKLKKALDEGKILIVSVDKGIFTERGHILVIKGYNKDGEFLINDPNSIINTNKSWSFDEIKGEIKKIWGISKPGYSKSSSKNEEKTKSESSSESDNNSSTSNSPSIIEDIEDIQ